MKEKYENYIVNRESLNSGEQTIYFKHIRSSSAIFVVLCFVFYCEESEEE